MTPNSVSPLPVLREAIKTVPFVKWALGLGGLLATIALLYVFRLDPRVTFVGLISLFVFMSILVLFARASTQEGGTTAWASLVFTWFTLIMFMVTTMALFGSVFLNTPLPFQKWLTGEEAMAKRTSPPARPAQISSATSLNRTGAGAFRQALLKQRPLELHRLQVRTEKIGTPEGQLFTDIGEVVPNCTHEGASGHVRARVYSETDFDDGSHDTLLLRDFRRNPANYKSPNQPGPVIGARVPTRMVPVLEGQCGPEMHEGLYPGETPT